MKRPRQLSRRPLVEATLAFVAGLFAVLAAVMPAWIEAFGIDPDHGDGSLEWAIPIMFGAAALLMGTAAWRHWHGDAVRAART